MVPVDLVSVALAVPAVRVTAPMVALGGGQVPEQGWSSMGELSFC